MISRPAQYLLRFDDLCPTMDRERWERFLPLLAQYKIRPILAVVPDNQDRALELSPPDAGFWEEMRARQASGATIALHGYRHLCVNRGRSLVPLARRTEFAGVPEEKQRAWIHAGLEILRGHGLEPNIWVAPRHGFNRATLRALRTEGIRLISDGFTRAPFERGGLTWIPQQLWEPVEKPSGLWTVCLHSNTASDASVRKLEEFLRSHAAQITSVDQVMASYTPSQRGLAGALYEASRLARIRLARMKKRLLGKA
jgi:predicted deacetylase